jgi:putative drug exporter of the RND superfamily
MPAQRRQAEVEGGRLARGLAAVLVALRFLIPVAWVAGAVAATISLPQLGAGGGGAIGDIVPEHSEAEQAAQAATERFGFPLAADTAVVQRNEAGLSLATQRRSFRAALATAEGRGPAPGELRAAVPLTDAPAAALEASGPATTMLTYLAFERGVDGADRVDLADQYADRELGGESGDVVGVTGAVPARQAQFEAIDDSLPLVEGASIAAVLLIVAIAFRAIGAPLVTLFSGAIAYLLMIRLVPWAGDRLGIAIPPEVEPVLVVLLLGLVTDYSVFYLSAMRRRLLRGDDRLPAARAAVAETAPLVFAAGLIVVAVTAALLAGELDFFRAFGPGLALTTLISLLVAGTLIPALMSIFGRRLFGRRLRAELAETSTEPPPRDPMEFEEVRRDLRLERPGEHGDRGGPVGRGRRALARPLLALRRARALGRANQTSPWRAFVARIASTRPVALAIGLVTIAALLAAASGLRTTELGVTYISGLPDDSEAKRAADAASEGFAPGILAPTEIDLAAPGIADRRTELARLESLVGEQPGVAATVGPREQPPAPAPPVMISDDGSGARIAVVFDNDPLGGPAIDDLDALEARMPSLIAQSGLDSATQVSFAGQTALAGETVDAVLDDFKLVGVLALLANVALLMVFLRALVAPLYLVAASVLGLAATLGLTTFFFQDLLGRDELTYYVPFAAAALLVALGSDYNVFVAGRIWREARRRRVPEAIAVATPSAARAITVAGLALASSFALLAIVPLDAFQEFAFVMVVGVLIDTFVVRSLLIPALTALLGEKAWWPGRRVEQLSSETVEERVAEQAGITVAAAGRATEAALATLGERIDRRERDELARRLPAHLRDRLLEAESGPEPFSASEFVDRMRDREGAESEATAKRHARAVFATLERTVPGGLDYIRVQLSEDYDELFGDGRVAHAEPARAEPSPTG